MKILNYNVNEIPIVLFITWMLLVFTFYNTYGIEGLVASVFSGILLYLPMIFIFTRFVGFIEKVDDDKPKVRGQK